MQTLFNSIENNFKELDTDSLFDYIIEIIKSPLIKTFINFQKEAKIPELKKEFKRIDIEKNRTYFLLLNSCIKNNEYLSFSSNLDWISLKQIEKTTNDTLFSITSNTKEEATILTINTCFQPFNKAAFYRSGILEKQGDIWLSNYQLINEKEIRFNEVTFLQ